MKSVDYKQKYLNMRNKMVSNMQRAYQLGYVKGAQDQEQESLMMEMQAQQNPQIDPNTGLPIDPGQMGQELPGQQMAAVQGQGDELDNSLDELEGMMSKSEKDIDHDKIKELLSNIRIKGDNLKNSAMLKSSDPKKLKLPIMKDRVRKIGAMKNLSDQKKAAVTAQARLVEGAMDKFKGSSMEKTMAIVNEIVEQEGKE